MEAVERLNDHWWWRSGWRTGRHFYACHLVMSEHEQVVRLVGKYQDALGTIGTLDVIPPQWLHLTLQGIGFLDEVSEAELAACITAIDARIAGLTPFEIAFREPVVRPEAVYLPATPAEGIEELRLAVRAGLTEVLGPGRVDDWGAYRPHVSLAYSNAEQPAAPIVEALSAVDADSATALIDELPVLEYHRDRRMYEWNTVRLIRLGTAAALGRSASVRP